MRTSLCLHLRVYVISTFKKRHKKCLSVLIKSWDFEISLFTDHHGGGQSWDEERLKFHTKFDSKFESVNLKHSIGWFIKLRTLGRQLYFSALLCDSIYDKYDKYDISNISISRSVSVMWRVHSFSYFLQKYNSFKLFI